MTRVCPSIHPSIHLSVHTWGGGGVPEPGSGRGVPQPGPVGSTLPGGTPSKGVSHPGYPLTDLAGGTPVGGTPPWVPPFRPGWGCTPCQVKDTPPRVPPIGPGQGNNPCLGVPHLGYFRSIRPGQGRYPLPEGTLLRETDGVLDTPRSVCLLHSRRRTFLFQSVTATLSLRHQFWGSTLTCFHPSCPSCMFSSSFRDSDNNHLCFFRNWL